MEELNMKFDGLLKSIEKIQELNNSQSRVIENVTQLSLDNQSGINTNTESIKLLKDMVAQNNDAISDVLSHIKTIYSYLP